MLLFMGAEGLLGLLFQALPFLGNRWLRKRTFWAYEDDRSKAVCPLLFAVADWPMRHTIWIQARGGGELHYLNLRFVRRNNTDYAPQDLSHLIKIDRIMVFGPAGQIIDHQLHDDGYGGQTIRFPKAFHMNSDDPIGIELDVIAAQRWNGFLGMKGDLGRPKRQWGWKAVEASEAPPVALA